MTVFGLIGYPLTHSFSRKYFLQKIKSEGLNLVDYQNFPLQKIAEINSLLAENQEIRGLNITAPHKQSVIEYVDELDASAQVAGAVNVIKIVRKNGKRKMIGYNTDVFGFQKSLEEHLPQNFKKTALILGTGGAARAVSVALNLLNFSFRFVSRKKKRSLNSLTYSKLSKSCIQNSSLIVNATTLGMFPETTQKPDLPYSELTEQHILFDLIYNPPQTAFLQEGRKHKSLIINGLDMLHYQADKAWQIFSEK